MGEISFPMGLLAIGSFLRKNRVDLEIVDFDLELKRHLLLKKWHYFKNYVIRRLKKTGAEFFGITSICSNYPVALLLAKEIRKRWPKCHIVFGGPHPSAVPEETLRVCPWVDVVVIGEGEVTFLELAKTDFSASSLQDISGIVFRNGEEIIRTPNREPIDSLDSLPFPDFDLVVLENYLSYAPRISLIEAGRGCPFFCSFCSTSKMWGQQFRIKSPDRILEEMRFLSRRYQLTSFGLIHDNFTTSRRFMDEFCDFFINNNHENFHWSASARSDALNRERLYDMERAGCRGLFFGVESGSPTIQKAIHKHLNLEQFQENHRIAASIGIPPITSLIIGFPEETEEDIEYTIRLGLWAKLNGSSVVQLHPLRVLPGTKIYEDNHFSLLYDPISISWDFNKQPHVDKEIEQFIKANPRLFTSFYSIITPFIGSLNLESVAFFYHELINCMASDIQNIFDTTPLNPLNLFRCWADWKCREYPNHPMNRQILLGTFADFLRATHGIMEAFC